MKFRGSFKPSSDEVLYKNYGKDTDKGLIIECGASDGVSENVSYFFERELGWDSINIEPSPYLFSKLNKNRPHSLFNLNIALSNTDGGRVFNDVGKGNSSLSHKEHQLKAQKQHNISPNFIDVKCLTFKTLAREYSILRVDILVLDVEGHELEVLEGFKNSSVTPNVLCIEYPHICVGIPGGLKGLIPIVEGYGYNFNMFVNNDAYFSKSYKEEDKNWFGAMPFSEEWVWDESRMVWSRRGLI